MIYFLIPLFNEENNVFQLLESLKNSLPGREKYFVFVDDCSTDKTKACISENIRNIPYHIIEKAERMGPGDSFNRGFEWILSYSNNQLDIIITMEGDNTTDWNALPKMLQIAEIGYDLVLASIYSQGGGFEQTTFFRKIISFIANVSIRSFLGIKVQTVSSFYRIYKLSLIKNIKLEFSTIIEEKGFICMLEILIKSIILKSSIIEVPVLLYSTRRKGKSKMKLFKTSISYLLFLFKYKRGSIV